MPADFYMLMNLPALAPDFLDAFRDFVVDVVSDGPPPPIRTRCYCFVRHTLETDKSRAGKLSEADGESRERFARHNAEGVVRFFTLQSPATSTNADETLVRV
ncbi:unnamed protein product [Mesocestoides corti]|uniref:ABM domain-containing protein n=1 Tax=Mesocestoides corti TaxID=53468 RepID=A0A0R3UJD5_MESCO|nr:unnamed protein product [Mesocestoides corti]